MVTMVRQIMTAPVDGVDRVDGVDGVDGVEGVEGVEGVVDRFDAVPEPPPGRTRPSGSATVRDV